MPLRARNFWPHSTIKSLVAPQRAHNFGHHSSSSFAVPCRVSHRPAASPVAGAGDSGRVRPLGWQEPRLNPLPSTTPKTAQKHSSCLSETPLYERTGFCVKFARAPTLGGPRLIAWSQPSPHRQHRQHRRRKPISHLRSAPPTMLGGALRRRGDAPVDATLEAALCSWGDKGPPPPPPRHRRDAPQDKRTKVTTCLGTAGKTRAESILASRA